MKSALLKKIMFGAVLLNSVVMFSQEGENPPPPPPPTPPVGFPIDSGIVLLVLGAIVLAFWYKNITTKKASN